MFHIKIFSKSFLSVSPAPCPIYLQNNQYLFNKFSFRSTKTKYKYEKYMRDKFSQNTLDYFILALGIIVLLYYTNKTELSPYIIFIEYRLIFSLLLYKYQKLCYSYI